VDNGSALAEVVEAKIEDAGALAIDHGHAQRRLGSEQGSQRFQMEARLEIDVRASQTRREFVLSPEILRGAGEDCLATAIATKISGQFENAIDVGVERSVLALRGGAFEGLLHDILGDDRLAAVGTILGRIGLKVTTQSAFAFGFVCLKIRQLTDFVSGHHLHAP
jgi:hypothetical protein